MNNIYGMSESELQDKLDALKQDGGYKNIRAINHKKLILIIQELEIRLTKLKARSKKDNAAWARLL